MRVMCLWTTQCGLRLKKRSADIASKTLASCVRVLCRHETNLTSKSSVFTLCLLQIAICFNKVLNLRYSLHKATIFYGHYISIQYSVSISKLQWEIFPAFNVANCEATVAKALQISADYS